MRRDDVRQDDEARGRGATRYLIWLTVMAVLAGLAITPTVAASASTPAPPVLRLLLPGGKLEPGQSLESKNGDYRLTMQRDGDLVAYRGHVRIWQTGTRSGFAVTATLGRRGIFTVATAHKTLWSTPAYLGHELVQHLVFTDAGNVALVATHDKRLWSLNLPPTLQFGDTGGAVVALQRRLTALGYWVGPVTGDFADSTQQAVWALQKAADLNRDGVVGSLTWRALGQGIVPTPRPAAGNLIEVNLSNDLLMVIRDGKLWATLNTSTGGGYTYTDQGVTSVAITPQGVFSIYTVINGLDVDSLGALWRPRFFSGGFAIHGDSYVPPYPVSHGCVRVSDEAINWIWADNVAPIGSEVWIYS